MTESNLYLLKLIDEEASTEEICERLNISKKQLKRRIESIKYEGYNIGRKYNYDATWNYFLNRNLNNEELSIHYCDPKEFRILAIADTHYGHKKGNINYAYMVYEYCKKNNINLVFHCGDVFEGIFQSKLDHEEQVEYFIEKFPYDSDILTFLSFGNHEEEFLKDSGLNIGKMIEKERDDVVPLGYNPKKIGVYGNKIILSHRGDFGREYGLKLKGHSHRYKFIADQNGPVIVVPTLSDYLHTTDYPGAVDLSISLDNNLSFNKIESKHLTINKNKIRETSTVEYPFKRMQRIRK